MYDVFTVKYNHLSYLRYAVLMSRIFIFFMKLRIASSMWQTCSCFSNGSFLYFCFPRTLLLPLPDLWARARFEVCLLLPAKSRKTLRGMFPFFWIFLNLSILNALLCSAFILWFFYFMLNKCHVLSYCFSCNHYF